MRGTTGVPGPEDDAGAAVKAGLARVYDKIAATYGTALDIFDVFGRDLVAIANIQPGDHVLDLACGRGACLRPASDVVGATGHVLGIDLSPEMVALLSQDLERDRVTNAEVRIDDAERVDFVDGSFDAITCGFGVHHFIHLVEVLAGYRQALRPGGRFAASTNTNGTVDYPWVPEVLTETGIVRPTLESRQSMRMLTAPALARALTDAGFDAVETTTLQHRFVFADVGAFMNWVRTQGIGTIINRLEPREIERFEQACEQRLKDHQAVDGYELVKSVDFTVAMRL